MEESSHDEKNDIIEEVWRNRDEFAKQHNYNLNDMVAKLQKLEQNPLSRLVDRTKLAPRSSGGESPACCRQALKPPNLDEPEP